MILQGAAIVTEAPVKITIAPAPSMVSVDLWDDFVPDFGALTAMRAEPRRWWVIDDDAELGPLKAQLGDHGSLTPVNGGLMRASLIGAGWREALMIGGWFNAEDAAFAVGCCAGTLIGHVSVRLCVVSETQCDVYFASSYRGAIEHHWQHLLEPAT
jgi:sarcosine oxidase gamma subunit